MELFKYTNEPTKIKISVLGLKFTYNKKLNKRKLDKEISNLCGICLNKEPRNPKFVVSMTSFPQRIDDIHYCIYSVLNQEVKPDKIILWLSDEEFCEKENSLPKTLTNLTKHGLSIKWCKNLKSYKKLIPLLKENNTDIIVTADDDVYYPSDWLKILYESYLQNPEYIHCHRAHKIEFDGSNNIAPYTKWNLCITDAEPSFLNFFTGVGGVLYPPYSLYKDITDENLFMQLAPNADDIWFWAMCVLNNKKISVVKTPITKFIPLNPKTQDEKSEYFSLFKINKTQNDIQLKNVLQKYPQIMSKLTGL